MKIGGSLSSKQMLLDIGAMRNYAMKLVEKSKPFTLLLQAILKDDFYYDDAKTLPSIKELAQETGLSYGKVRDQILKIYTDLVIDFDSRITLSIPKVEYIFFMKSFLDDKSFEVSLDYLPIVPRVGDDIQLPFFKAYLNIAHFHVKQVEHDFDHDSQTIYIWLEPGFKAWGLQGD